MLKKKKKDTTRNVRQSEALLAELRKWFSDKRSLVVFDYPFEHADLLASPN